MARKKSHPKKGAPAKRGRKPILEPVAVGVALLKHRGNLSAVARQFKVDRHAVRNLIDKHEPLKLALSDARESFLDDAENALHRSVLAGEGWAVCFALKTQGKGRGYVEKSEVEHSGTVAQTHIYLPQKNPAPDASPAPGENPPANS